MCCCRVVCVGSLGRSVVAEISQPGPQPFTEAGAFDVIHFVTMEKREEDIWLPDKTGPRLDCTRLFFFRTDLRRVVCEEVVPSL